MIIEFLGAAHEVTGSCHYVEVGDKKFLVDCGMEQGPDIYENQEIPVQASSIDYVFVTHAHIDHSGLLPLLYAHGFRGQIYATEATCELCNIMLKDSAHIQTFEAEWKNRKAKRAGRPEVTPLYTVEDAAGVLEQFVPVHYHETIKVCDEITVRFVDAGPLLGSSSIEVWLTEGNEKLFDRLDVEQDDANILSAIQEKTEKNDNITRIWLSGSVGEDKEITTVGIYNAKTEKGYLLSVLYNKKDASEISSITYETLMEDSGKEA